MDSQLFYTAYRFDLKGKRQLEINNKYYAADLGLRHSQIGYRSSDISYLLENLVYLEQLRRYDQVYTGEMGKWKLILLR